MHFDHGVMVMDDSTAIERGGRMMAPAESEAMEMENNALAKKGKGEAAGKTRPGLILILNYHSGKPTLRIGIAGQLYPGC